MMDSIASKGAGEGRRNRPQVQNRASDDRPCRVPAGGRVTDLRRAEISPQSRNLRSVTAKYARAQHL